jgi:hypothetical protein
MTVKMHHGTSSKSLTLHVGLCLVVDEDRAAEYAQAAFGTHFVHEVTVDLDGLAVKEVEGEWDRDEAAAASDFGGDFGADIIVYDDETPYQRQHITYRLMTPAALAAVTVTATRDAEDI